MRRRNKPCKGLALTTMGDDMTIRNPNDISLRPAISNAEPADSVEAVRYALLQRLTPALQHHMMGQLQSMGMIAAMMEKRLQSAAPDLASIRMDCASLGNVSQTAQSAIINMMSWIEPKPALPLNVDTGVKECLGLLSTQFRFKGFAIVNEVPQINGGVSARSLRSVLSATLIALSDLSQAPADLVIQAQAMTDCVDVSVTLRATERRQKNDYSTTFRLLKWSDVEVLAAAEAVKLTHDDTGAHLIFSYSDEAARPHFPNGSAAGASR